MDLQEQLLKALALVMHDITLDNVGFSGLLVEYVWGKCFFQASSATEEDIWCLIS